MAEAETLVPYDLHDVNDGNIYRIYVSEKTKQQLDVDHHQCFREILEAKERGVKPIGQWLDTSLNTTTKRPLATEGPVPAPSLDGNANVLRSPPKKKNRKKKATSTIAAPPNAITSWTEEKAVHWFLYELSLRLEKFAKSKKHEHLWIEISEALQLNNMYFSPEACKDKRATLTSYYSRVKGSNGQIGKSGKIWAFYNEMQAIAKKEPLPIPSAPNNDYMRNLGVYISPVQNNEYLNNIDMYVAPNVVNANTEEHSIEENEEVLEAQIELAADIEVDTEEHSFAAPDLDQGADANNIENVGDVPVQVVRPAPVPQRNLDAAWDEVSEPALVEEYLDRKEDFDGNLLRADTPFAEIATRLSFATKTCTGPQCKAKFAQLQVEFRREHDRLDNTGEGKCEFALYDLFLNIEGENSHGLKPPITISSGSTNVVKRVGAIVEKLRTTKGRPPTDSRQRKLVENLIGNPRTGVGHKERNLTMQQQRLDQGDQFLKEFSAYRKEAKERGECIREGLQLLKDARNRANTL